ncbi:AMP-binding protein [Gemmobacter sp.]|uniref:AMP-binding protein n=1 Tax=Gemmobacter sp. TaxID=1898957 RepID=UPI002AFEE607|nr:AMP-binding protein [Gemmobacter sp.]
MTTEPRLDPRMPPRDACVLQAMVDRLAVDRADAVFALFDDGTRWTYADLAQVVRRTAAGLAGLGIRKGDHVAVWLPNGPDMLRVWFAVNYLGAVMVPINLAYRGGVLEHALDLSDARLIVVHSGLADRLAEVPTARLGAAVVLSGPAPALALPCHGAEVLDGDPAVLDRLDRRVEPWDLQCLMFTSGTTGRSKAVRSSYLHLWSVCDYPYRMLTADDRFMVNLPLFHVGGTVPVYAMLMRGASIAVVDSFRASDFWAAIRRTGSTVVTMLGSMTPLVWAAPATPDDADTPLRVALMIPLVMDARAFGTRFGCEVYTLFNMTEISTPIFSDLYPALPGTCGRLRPGVQGRVVDGNDCELPPGVVGELVVRADTPWVFTDGYHRDPQATARAWRNGWFHTGDAFRSDADGNFFFADRMKDAIRRRGENISSFEVEAEVARHPNVAEVAVIAARDAIGEEEVMAVMILRDPAGHDPVEMAGFLQRRLPHFMVPRYLRVVAELPRTPTQKVQKHVLRDQGITPDTWDREAAGIILKRTRLNA